MLLVHLGRRSTGLSEQESDLALERAPDFEMWPARLSQLVDIRYKVSIIVQIQNMYIF